MSSAEDQHRRNAALRELPGVDTASGWPELAGVPPRARLQALRELLDQVRTELLHGSRADCPGRAELVERLLRQFQVLVTPSLRPVINATGVLLHTNLGRAPLPESAIEAVRAAAGNTNLEYDLDLGTRGGRGSGVNQLLCTLSGAPAALVVNNCAAAVLLCISTLAAGKEVIVSRGELVEIGGSFRIPEVVTQGGARLREVGTTNRTHLRDYAAAIGADTAGILKVHASNFQVVGFTHEVSVAELVELARQRSESEGRKLFVLEDLGSASFLPLSVDGAIRTPTPLDSLSVGADLVCFSGDKLIGGPQAGLILGSSEAVGAARRHPFYRALRPGKLTLAALEATLRHHLDPSGREHLPLHAAISRTVESLTARAERLLEALAGAEGVTLERVPTDATIGGGSIPGQRVPSVAVRLRFHEREASEAAAELRRGPRPVVGRVKDGALWLDLRTVHPDADDVLAALLRGLLWGAS